MTKQFNSLLGLHDIKIGSCDPDNAGMGVKPVPASIAVFHILRRFALPAIALHGVAESRKHFEKIIWMIDIHNGVLQKIWLGFSIFNARTAWRSGERSVDVG